MIRMKKKKIIGILVALCLFIFLSACLITSCGGGNDKATESSSETKTETEITASVKDKKNDSKKEESEKETESEKSDNAKDETEETSKTSETKKETSNSSASQSSQPSTSKPSTSSGNSGSASKPYEPAETQSSEPAHTHTWVWATHTETTPEQSHVVEVKKYVCNGCGAQFDDNTGILRHVAADFWDDCENYTYKVVDSQTVIDVPAQTITVNDYEYCSECGARK